MSRSEKTVKVFLKIAEVSAHDWMVVRERIMAAEL